MKFRSLILFFIIFIFIYAHPSSVLGEDTFLKKHIAQKIAERENIRGQLSQEEKNVLDMDLFHAVDDDDYDVVKDLLMRGADPNFTLWFQFPMYFSPWNRGISINFIGDFPHFFYEILNIHGWDSIHINNKFRNPPNIICMSKEELPPLDPGQGRTEVFLLRRAIDLKTNRHDMALLLLFYGANPNIDQEIEIKPKEPVYLAPTHREMTGLVSRAWWPPRRYEYLKFRIKGASLYHLFLYVKDEIESQQVYGHLREMILLDEHLAQMLVLFISFGIQDEYEVMFEKETVDKHSLLPTIQEHIALLETGLEYLNETFFNKLKFRWLGKRWLGKFGSSFFKYHPFLNGHFNHARFAQDVGKAIGPEFAEEVGDELKEITKRIDDDFEQLQRWKTLHYLLMKRDAKSK